MLAWVMDEINNSTVKKAWLRLPFIGRYSGIWAILLLLPACGANVLDLSARGHIDHLDSLLTSDATLIHVQNNLGQSSIHYAASHNRLDSFFVLLEHGVDLDIQDGTGLTPLHMAAGGDHHFLVRELLKKGVQSDSLDSFGNTALHHASIHGGTRAVQELISFGVGLDGFNTEKKTALTLAREFKRDEVVKLLNEAMNLAEGAL